MSQGLRITSAGAGSMTGLSPLIFQHLRKNGKEKLVIQTVSASLSVDFPQLPPYVTRMSSQTVSITEDLRVLSASGFSSEAFSCLLNRDKTILREEYSSLLRRA